MPWEDMDDGARTILAENLGYTELTWNVHRLAEVESRGHFELMYFESDAAETVLGLDQAGWDCWINHYDSYGWADLEGWGLAGAMSGLGWNESSWEGGGGSAPVRLDVLGRSHRGQAATRHGPVPVLGELGHDRHD